ncbi:MAG: oligomeric, coiled-coil, peripheral membrane protein [Icmadophila ericetorum]|nr:oligomeric, coiled-coil, peripheral membrane protein [Icmadophila ericetorum]
MSLHIFLAHTGYCLIANPTSFKSLDHLRLWIGQNSSVEASDQILMTARGKQVKLQTLAVEAEVFVYDRNLLTDGATKRNAPKTTPLAPFTPGDPPDSLKDQNSIQSWQQLFRDRKAWAVELSEKCDWMINETRQADEEASVVQRATAIAVENIKQHVGNLHQKYEEANTWASESLHEYAALLNQYESVLRKLSLIPANELLKNFLSSGGHTTARPKQLGKKFTLYDFVDAAALRESASIARSVSENLAKRSSDLTRTFDSVVQESSSLIDNFTYEFAPMTEDVPEMSSRLAEEMEVVVKKISNDYEANTGQNTPKSVAAISRTALLHTRDFLPSLLTTSSEVNQLRRKVIEHKDRISEAALIHMQRISKIESVLASIHPRLAALDIGADGSKAINMISFAVNLPSLYGSLLVEAIYRREWSERMTSDSSTLAEEMAVYKEEEERRRKRWAKSMGDFVNNESVQPKALGIEINLKSQDQAWPRVTRDDIDAFTACLSTLGGFEDVLKEIEIASKVLDAPTKQQVRRQKAFKNGSVHEATQGRGSLLLRADDELLRSLQTEKSKLEDRLKGSESRVRKLEDLLHRQSQISNPSTGHTYGFPHGQHPERPSISPILNQDPTFQKQPSSHSRQSSISSRRFSANITPEDKTLVQRIVKLESELAAEKLRSTELQAATTNKENLEAELKNEVQEAVSTKQDLMDNLEAQQHEFDDERRLLEGDARKWKIRVEEVEDELDRLIGSRDNEKVGTDDKVRKLEADLNAQRGAAEELQKTRSQLDSLRDDHNTQRERIRQLESRVNEQIEAKTEVQQELAEWKLKMQFHDELQAEQMTTLRAAHKQLTSDEPAPDGFNSLIEHIEVLAERSASHLREIKQMLETSRSDNASLEAQSKKQTDEIYDLTDRLSLEETEISNLGAKLAEQQSQFEALQTELKDTRSERTSLRSRFAAGETGAEALRSRLASEEAKAESLSTQLATATKYIETFEAEQLDKSNHAKELERRLDMVTTNFDIRGRRAEEISTNLVLQVDRLGRLLEQIGFTITREAGEMLVQRIPKASSASTTLDNQLQSMGKSTIVSPITAARAESPIPEYVHWVGTEDMALENQKYEDFIKDIQAFNMDTFSEAIIKRVRDSDHTARKWQREAKAYREKYHRTQSEAHEKIAFRSFKEGDLALFLPTRNQATRPWAAFNVGAPHYFLREQDTHKLRAREWLLARISKIEERVVDLSRSINGLHPPSDRASIGERSDGGASFDDENPFELSDGLRWYLLDAAEEKPGAPTTPGPAKSTVASNNVDAKGSIQHNKKSPKDHLATKTLTKSLDSRRSSSNSKKSLIGVVTNAVHRNSIVESDAGSLRVQDGGPRSPRPETPKDVTDAALLIMNPRSLEEGKALASRSSSPMKSGTVSPNKSPSKPSRPVPHASIQYGAGGSGSGSGSLPNISPARRQDGASPEKEKRKSKVWDSSWSLDLSYESKSPMKKR